MRHHVSILKTKHDYSDRILSRGLVMMLKRSGRVGEQVSCPHALRPTVVAVSFLLLIKSVTAARHDPPEQLRNTAVSAPVNEDVDYGYDSGSSYAYFDMERFTIRDSQQRAREGHVQNPRAGGPPPPLGLDVDVPASGSTYSREPNAQQLSANSGAGSSTMSSSTSSIAKAGSNGGAGTSTPSTGSGSRYQRGSPSGAPASAHSSDSSSTASHTTDPTAAAAATDPAATVIGGGGRRAEPGQGRRGAPAPEGIPPGRPDQLLQRHHQRLPAEALVDRRVPVGAARMARVGGAAGVGVLGGARDPWAVRSGGLGRRRRLGVNEYYSYCLTAPRDLYDKCYPCDSYDDPCLVGWRTVVLPGWQCATGGWD